MVCAGGGFAGGAAGYAALAVRVVLPHRRTLKLAMIRAASAYCLLGGLKLQELYRGLVAQDLQGLLCQHGGGSRQGEQHEARHGTALWTKETQNA